MYTDVKEFLPELKALEFDKKKHKILSLFSMLRISTLQATTLGCRAKRDTLDIML